MTAYYNEFDPYAAQWLRNLIAKGLIAPGEVDERSIIEVQPDDLKGFTQCHFFAGIGGWSYAARLAGWPDDRPLWTGSAPCQPFSLAGKNEGQEDERHLWPELFRLIDARTPPVFMGEQVAAAIGKDWLDRVLVDLEGVGYACGATVIPACAVDAPHRRDRIWIVADANSGDPMVDRVGSRLEGQRGHVDDRHQPGWFDPSAVGSVAASGRFVSDTEQVGRDEEVARNLRAEEGARRAYGNLSYRPWAGSEWAVGTDGKARRVEPGIRLLAHGVSGRMVVRRPVGHGDAAHEEENRYSRKGGLTAFGNAIVPQVAAEVIGAYIDASPRWYRGAPQFEGVSV